MVEAYVSTDEVRVPRAGQAVFAACLDTEEPGDTSFRAIMRLPNFLARCIGSRPGSEAYDNTEDHMPRNMDLSKISGLSANL